MTKPEKPEKKDKRPRKSLEYWKRRAEARMYEEMEKAEDSADTVSRVYAMAARYLMDKADQVFDRYQTTEKLSEAEAVQMLNSMDNIEDMNELERKLTEDGSEEAMRSLERLKNTGAYGSRIGRLGELLNQVNDLMSNIYKQDVKETRGILSEIASDSYLKTMYDHQQRIGIGFSVAHLDKKRVDKVLNMNWSGKHFSERLWGNTQKLGQRVKEEMVVGALTGKTEREMAEDISKEFGRGNMEARRLIRTESCYVASEVNAEAYEDADIEKYLFLATLDLRTSPVCRELDGKRFPVKDRHPGVNCPPMHPWCRSTTIAIVDEEYLKDMTRSMRNPETGQTEQVPLSMTYEQWYKEYVKDSGDNRILSANNEPIEHNGTIINEVASVDYNDEKQCILGLESIEKQSVELPYEINCTITSDGKVWYCIGDNASVDPSGITSSLKGSYSYHNHPIEETYHSFSNKDVAFFIEKGQKYSKASDLEYEYIMERTDDTKELDYDTVVEMFDEIQMKESFQLAMDGEIEDIDVYHETMVRLSEKLGINYRRYKRGK